MKRQPSELPGPACAETPTDGGCGPAADSELNAMLRVGRRAAAKKPHSPVPLASQFGLCPDRSLRGLPSRCRDRDSRWWRLLPGGRSRRKEGDMRTVLRSRRGRYSGLVVLFGVVVVALLVSPVGSARTQVAPTNTVLPAITGFPAVGQTLTTSDGTWDGSPTSFTYQWFRCPASGGQPNASDCAAIGGATTNSYAPATGDVGFTLRAQVTAINPDGQTTATSNATAVVAAQAGPPNTSPPTITGTTTVGSTLTANPGTWTGTSITFAYQWQRCDTAGANCNHIRNAASTTYVLANEDLGHTIRVSVTATDATGPNTVTSAQTGVVTNAPAPPPTGCPPNKSAGPINVSEVSPPAHLLIDGQSSRPAVIGGNTQTVVLRFHISACNGRPVVGALVYQTATPYQQFSDSE